MEAWVARAARAISAPPRLAATAPPWFAAANETRLELRGSGFAACMCDAAAVSEEVEFEEFDCTLKQLLTASKASEKPIRYLTRGSLLPFIRYLLTYRQGQILYKCLCLVSKLQG